MSYISNNRLNYARETENIAFQCTKRGIREGMKRSSVYLNLLVCLFNSTRKSDTLLLKRVMLSIEYLYYYDHQPCNSVIFVT